MIKGYVENVQKYKDFDFGQNIFEGDLNLFIGSANHYLIYLKNCTWNGSSGFKIVSDVNDIFYRGYDCKIHLSQGYKRGRVLKCIEYHHDVPTGHASYIVALSDANYDRLVNHSTKYSMFDNIENLLQEMGVS